jgi:hypothetical protein
MDEKTLTLQQMIEQDREERVQRVVEALKRALEVERCELDVAVLVSARGIVPQVRVVAKD